MKNYIFCDYWSRKWDAGYIPEFVTVTEAKHREEKESPKLNLKTGDVVVFDRGYTDFYT